MNDTSAYAIMTKSCMVVILGPLYMYTWFREMYVHYSLSVEASREISSENRILNKVCPVHITLTVVQVRINRHQENS